MPEDNDLYLHPCENISQPFKNSLPFTETEDLLPYSQELATGPLRQPDESGSQPYISYAIF